MKIVVIGFRFNCPTGIRNIHVYQKLIEHYDDLLIDIFTVSKYENNYDNKNLSNEKLRIFKLLTFFHNYGQFKYFMPGLYLRLLFTNAEIIYAQEEPIQVFVTFPALLIAKLRRKKFLFFTWENIYQKQPFPMNIIEKFIIRYADGVIVGSDDAKKIIIKKGALSNKKIHTFPETGINLEIFKPESGYRINNWEKNKLILFVGRFLPEKGITTILKSRDLLIKKGRKYKYLFVGKGPLSYLVKNIEEKSDDVKVIDWLSMEKLPNIYNSANLFIYPSNITKRWIEQFGFSMVEALSCQIPVIASRVTGPKTIVKEGKDGFLITPGDAKGLAEKIELLMEDKTLNRRFGKFGRKDMIKRFSDYVISKKLYHVFNNLLK